MSESNSKIGYINLAIVDDSTFTVELSLTYKNTDFSKVLGKLRELTEFLECPIDTLNEK